MILKVFKIFFFCLLTANAYSQYRLSGIITSRDDSTAVKDCTVYLTDGKKSAVTDTYGRFVFDDIANGTYVLHFTSMEYEYTQMQVSVANSNEAVRVVLAPRTETLAEIMITDAQSNVGKTRARVYSSASEAAA
jgi:Fe(3+) dicitrate transport protein